MSKALIFWAAPAIAMLTGCAIAAKDSARHDMDASKAAYKACLVENMQNVAACDGLRRTYETDLAAYDATAAAIRPGPVYNNQEPAPLPQPEFGQPVISSGDCVGAVVNSICHGMPAPGAPMATCYAR